MFPNSIFRWLACLLIAVTCLAAGGTAKAIEPPSGWARFGGLPEGCNGPVHAMARLGDGRVVLGGNFTLCGSAAANSVAIWDPNAPGFETLGKGPTNGVSGFVHALMVDGDSVWVGGRFRTAGGQTANSIARWNASTNAWQTIAVGSLVGVGESAHVFAFAMDGPDIYVGGRFIRGANLPSRPLARWNRDRNEWSLLGTSGLVAFNDSVSALLIHDRVLYVAGQFQSTNPSGRGIARWHLDEKTWFPIRGGSITSGAWVSELAYHQGAIYVGGLFSGVGGVAATNIARLDLASDRWTAVGPPNVEGISGEVRALAVVDGELIAGGLFASSGSGQMASQNLARYRLDLGQWVPVVVGATDRVNALLPGDGRAFVAGDFRAAGGRPVRHVAVFRTAEDAWMTLGQFGGRGLDGEPRAIAVDAEGVYVAGSLWPSIGGPRQGIVTWNPANERWQSMGEPVGNLSQIGVAVAISGGKVYLGGRFPSIGHSNSPNVAAWLRPTGPWRSVGGGVWQDQVPYGSVTSLAPHPGGVTIAGFFNVVGGQSAANIAHFGSGGWRPSSVSPAESPTDGQLVLADGGDEVFVGGRFTTAGLIPASRIARWHRESGLWSTLGPAPEDGVDGPVTAIAVSDPWVYVTGEFTRAGTISVPGVARWHRPTGQWHPMGTSEASSGLPRQIQAIAAIGTNVYFGGLVPVDEEPPQGRILRWDARTETWQRLDEGEIDGPVTGFATLGSELWVVGGFRTVGGEVSSGVARWRLDPRAADRLLGDGFEVVP